MNYMQLSEMVREAYRAGFIAGRNTFGQPRQEVNSTAYNKKFNEWSFSVRDTHAAIIAGQQRNTEGSVSAVPAIRPQRCPAHVIHPKPSPPGPSNPPIWCCLREGHDGPHRHDGGGMYPSIPFRENDKVSMQSSNATGSASTGDLLIDALRKVERSRIEATDRLKKLEAKLPCEAIVQCCDAKGAWLICADNLPLVEDMRVFVSAYPNQQSSNAAVTDEMVNEAIRAAEDYATGVFIGWDTMYVALEAALCKGETK